MSAMSLRLLEKAFCGPCISKIELKGLHLSKNPMQVFKPTLIATITGLCESMSLREKEGYTMDRIEKWFIGFSIVALCYGFLCLWIVLKFF
tara:strand:+ start:20346 stop:20618 length:273 start_codon:yes stop_codon:yes gene_type:complete